MRDQVEEIIHLFFVYDTLLFYESDRRILLNIICILMGFQAVLGLNINLSKSEMVRLRSEGDPNGLTRAPGCKVVSLPITYLGLPFGAKFKEAMMWELVVNKFEKRLKGWKRALLSIRR